jgi:hypothetical protein
MLTPQEYIKSLQTEGVLLVVKDVFYFIPLDVLSELKMPLEFQKDFPKVSDDYFEKVTPTDLNANLTDPNTPSVVFGGMNRALADAFGLDGVNQAIFLEAAQADAAGKLTSKTGKSLQVLFRYNANKTKIFVDLSKGGRPSNG